MPERELFFHREVVVFDHSEGFGFPALLRQCGYNPDDARNVLPTADDYIAMFAEAKKRLQARTDTDFHSMQDDPRFTELLYPEAP